MSPDPTLAHEVGERLSEVRTAIAAAAEEVGRDPAGVTLVVVTKAAEPEIFGVLAEAGVGDVGENRLQRVDERMAGHERDFRWHFIGHVQSNKARRVVERFDVLHGIDSVPLLERVERLAGELARRPDVLLQVNVSGEASKSGFAPEAVAAAVELGSRLRHARLVGLMTMAPQVDDPEETRGVFRRLAALRDELAGLHPLPELSMGMTDDFGVAVQEGATLVRIGRRIVGSRPMT